MTTAYIVLSGEQSNGGDVKGVFASHSAATKFALAMPAVFAGGWEATDADMWTNGCDWLAVESWEITP